MPDPARNTLAVIGAGPVGLETAFAALDAGLDVHVFERGEVASHPVAWGHVRMFTPWASTLGPVTRAHLEAAGWSAPPAGDCPTGQEFAEALQRAAALPEIAPRVHTLAQVVHVGRRAMLKEEHPGGAARRTRPFRLLVRDHGGRENFLHAHSVVDASGTYGQPRWAGTGGIPARGELYLAPQMSYHVDDVLGLRRARHAGKRTLVVGGGLSAATVVSDLARLAAEVPGTTVAWATRQESSALYAPFANDPVPGRAALMERARALLAGADSAVTHVGGVWVEELSFNSATHRYRATLMKGEQGQIEEADQVIVLCGFGPDRSLYAELQVHECYASRGPMKLSAALLGANAGGDCLQVPAMEGGLLAHPEPGFWILGAKSYGTASTFLLETGYRQVAEVVAALAAEAGAAVR